MCIDNTYVATQGRGSLSHILSLVFSLLGAILAALYIPVEWIFPLILVELGMIVAAVIIRMSKRFIGVGFLYIPLPPFLEPPSIPW